MMVIVIRSSINVNPQIGDRFFGQFVFIIHYTFYIIHYFEQGEKQDFLISWIGDFIITTNSTGTTTRNYLAAGF